MFEKTVSFINPRHTYAPKEKRELGGVCLPVGPLLQAARVKEAGAEVSVHDENIGPLDLPADTGAVAVGVLGPVYIGYAQKLHRSLRKKLGSKTPVVFGGPGVNNSVLSSETFASHFPDAIYGNDDASLAAAVGIDVRAMPDQENTSLVPVLEQISDSDFKKYLEANPLPFYLSQGCRFKCTFCIADKNIPEAYRSPKVLEKDFRYLVERAGKLGVSELNIYLSNLDVFQTPKKLLQFAETVLKVRKDNPRVNVKMRGLSTTAYFLKAHRNMPAAIRKIVEAGFDTVGFGIDGSPEAWATVGKNQNTIKICEDALRVARSVYGIRPQILEVVGFSNETQESLGKSLKFGLDIAAEVDAEVRPYVAKEDMPSLMKNPGNWRRSDFSAWSSEPNFEHRELVNRFYAEYLNDPRNTTIPVWVPSKKLTGAERGQLEKRFPNRTFSEGLTAAECDELNQGSYDT